MVNPKKSTKNGYTGSFEEIEMILDNIPGFVFYKDDKNNLIRVNKYFADAHKTTKDKLAGKNFFDIYPKDEAQKYLDDDLEVIKSKKPKLNFIEPWDAAEGRRWLNSSKIPLFDENNKSIGIIGFSTDVTAQVKAEQKLKQSQDQLNSMFSSLKDSVFVISEDYKILFKNDTAHDLFGTDLIGKDCYKLIKGQDQPCERCPMKTFAENGLCQVRFEQCINTPLLEEERVFDIVASPIESYAGQPALVEVLRDNTESAKMEAEIRKLSAYNRNLIEVSLDPLLTIDQDGKITDVNFALETITGLSREKLIGTEFSLYFTAPEKATEGYKRVFETGSVQDYELGFQHVDGHVTPVLYNASIFKDENGKVMGVFAAARDISKIKLAEQKLNEYSRNLEDRVEQRSLNLRKQLEEKQSYLDIAGVMLLIINADGTVKQINKKGSEILSYAEEQIIGKNWVDNFIPKEKQKEIKSFFRKIMAGEMEPFEYYEVPILTKEGKEKLIALHNTILKDEKSNIIGILSSGEDITERKKTEKEIVNLAKFPSEIPNPVLRVTKEKVIYLNNAGETIFDIKEGDILPELVSDVVFKAIDKDVIKKLELELNNRIYSLVITPIKEEGYVNIYGMDITELKKVEMELQFERDKLINILSSMKDGVYIVDQNYDLEYVNPISINEFGQYEGKKCYEYLYSCQGVCPWCKNQEVLKGNTVRWEFYSLRNQKTYDNIDTPLKNIDGSTSKLKISRDITKFKKSEQDLLSTLKNLKSANIELERFAYVASHDLQEPLRMIVSFIQLLEKRYKGKLDEDADEFIAFIVDGAKRMQTLIDDLLLFSRIGRIVKPFSSIDINVVIDSVINNLKKSIVETNAKITYDPLPKLMGNEVELVQLLQNLISNSIKFHKEEEPPVVHISAKLQKNQWIFSVRDNGIGIDSQFFDRIFIIFQRLHKKSEYEGTGIGLAICKKIIERHKGIIWVESELGKGSTFYFSIPKTEVKN